MSRNYITTAADGSATVRRKVPPLGLKPSVGMTGYGQTQGPSTRAEALGRDDRLWANARVPPLGLKPSVGMTGYMPTHAWAEALGRDDRLWANARSLHSG